ncbi:MAG: CRTAC1 family protein, partial [Hyphomicrobiales bacterium]|nr:CRTAC1 family protein [Hyphomicrobiales bacterium]
MCLPPLPAQPVERRAFWRTPYVGERVGVRGLGKKARPAAKPPAPHPSLLPAGGEKGLGAARLLLAFSFLLALVCAAPALADDARPKPLGDVPIFHEEAQAAGVNSVYDGPWEFFVGGGGAALDCDGSGFPSVFLAGGKNRARLFVNKSKAGGPLKFEEKPLDIGADPSLLDNVIGAYPIDIDGDGHMDLFVLRVGTNLLLKGGPNCTFTLANKEWGFEGDTGWTTSFAAEWEKGQKFPTFAIGHYVDRSAPGSPWGACEENSLYRPQPGDKPDYSVRTPLAPGFCALSMLFTDWNRSGVPSLRVSNDRQYYRGGEEQMWRIEPGKPPRLYGRTDGWRHLSIFGMGIAEGDIDGSGFPQYALTSMGDTKLQKLDPDEAGRGDYPVYRDIAGELGATAHIPYAGGDKRPSTGWHSEFADFNNAGLLDLFIAKGNVAQMPDFAAFDPNNLLLGQWNGKFVEAGDLAGLALNRQGRGALIADFNLDGNLDLLVINRGSPATLFRNLGADDGRGGTRPMGNWSEIRLVEPNPNRDAVGAKIAIKTGTRTQMRTVQVGGGDASGHAGWIHVGLGTSERAEIRVQWPDGEWSYPYRVFA